MQCHPHDAKWIDEQLEKLPYHVRGAVKEKYSVAYWEKLCEHEGEIGAEGIARKEANTRLRAYVDKYKATFNNKFSDIPRVR